MKDLEHIKKAAALKYQQNAQNAPKIVASGKGMIAQKIVERAKLFDIPIFQNEALVNSLVDLEIGEEIPPKLYNAVVEVFIWLYQSEKKAELSQT